jgi:APA family basic amino acid/polyamine antiporter
MTSTPRPAGGLLSVLGVGFGIAGAVGGTIGAGILRTPGLVAAQLGSPGWILAAWIAGGLYALLGAVCVAELGASLPRAGGWYVYARRAYGDAVGFCVGWIDWLGHCAGLAWVAVTTAGYSHELWPALPLGERPLALLLLALFALVQLAGVRAAGAGQQLLSLVKAVAFLALVGAFLLLGHGAAAPLAGAPAAGAGVAAAGPASALAVVLALQAVITTYDGWHSPIYFAEEFSEPGRDLPRSLLGGVLAVVLIYVLVNVALLQVLPPERIAASSLPVADAAALLFGGLSDTLITGLCLVSLLGLINAAVMGAPRILYGLSRDGLFAPVLAGVNPGGTPVPALLATTLCTGLLVLAGSFERLLGIAAFLYVALYATGISALLVLRRREPDLARPFRSWGQPWNALLVIGVSLAFLVAAGIGDRLDSGLALLLAGVGLPLRLGVARLGAAGENGAVAEAGNDAGRPG